MGPFGHLGKKGGPSLEEGGPTGPEPGPNPADAARFALSSWLVLVLGLQFSPGGGSLRKRLFFIEVYCHRAAAPPSKYFNLPPLCHTVQRHLDQRPLSQKASSPKGPFSQKPLLPNAPSSEKHYGPCCAFFGPVRTHEAGPRAWIGQDRIG